MAASGSVRTAMFVGVVLVLALVAAACGDDGDQASTEQFCAELEAQEANQDLDLDNPEDLAAFEELIDEAPDEVRPALEEFRDLAQEFEDLEESDPDEAFGALFAVFANPDFLRALQDLSIFMADECGLEVEGIDEIRELDPDDPASLFEGFETGPEEPADGADGSDPDGSADPADPDGGDDDEPSATDQLSSYIDENHADEGWADLVVSRAIGSFGESADITVSLDTQSGPVSEADAVAACEAVADWALSTYSGDVSVTITGFNGDELVGADGDADCVAA